MLITFKSKAAADIIMYKTHAKRILTLLGKEIDRGVITAEETAQAIARLEAAIAESKNQDADNAVAAADHDGDDQQIQHVAHAEGYPAEGSAKKPTDVRVYSSGIVRLHPFVIQG